MTRCPFCDRIWDVDCDETCSRCGVRVCAACCLFTRTPEDRLGDPFCAPRGDELPGKGCAPEAFQ